MTTWLAIILCTTLFAAFAGGMIGLAALVGKQGNPADEILNLFVLPAALFGVTCGLAVVMFRAVRG